MTKRVTAGPYRADQDLALRPIASAPKEPTCVGIFRYHNCWKCKDGTRLDLCPTPECPGNCGYPHARND